MRVGSFRSSEVSRRRDGDFGRGGFGPVLEKIPIRGHGQQGPTVSVDVVFEIENFGEACAGRFEFCPGAVRVLGAN